MLLLSETSKPTGHGHMPLQGLASVSSASFKQCHPIHVGNGGDSVWNDCDLACGRAGCDDELKGQVVMNEFASADHAGPTHSRFLLSHKGARIAVTPTLHRTMQTFGTLNDVDKVLFSNEFIFAAKPVIAADMRKGTN